MRSRAPLFSGKVGSKKRLCRSRAVKVHTEINQRLENWGARLRISGGCPVRGEPEALKIFAQASRAKTKSMGLRLFCKLFMNPIDKVGE